MEGFKKGSIGWLKEQARKDGFDSLNDWNKWKRENIPKKKSDFLNQSNYDDYIAQGRGFKNRFDMYKKRYEDNKDNILFNTQIRRWKNEICSPQWENENCATYLGIEIGERIVGRFVIPILIGNIEKEMPYGNRGYDFVTVDNTKIDVKARCLNYKEQLRYNINYNNMADKFLLIGFDNRMLLNIIHIWSFSSNDEIRHNKFWRRDELCITNKPGLLIDFKNYEVTDILNLGELLSEINGYRLNLDK